METITPSEKSQTISQAKDKLFNELIEKRAGYMQKHIEGVATAFDYTALLGSFFGIVSHTIYYLPKGRKFKNTTLQDASFEFVQRVINNKNIDTKTRMEGLDLIAEYITALQEESICPYK